MESGKSSAFYSILLSITQVLYPLITFPYVSRLFSANGIGAVAFTDNITQYLILISALGIPIYGIREIAKVSADRERRSSVFSELMSIHLASSILLFICYIIAILYFPRFQENQSLFYIGSGILLLNALPAEWYFQGVQKFKLIAFRTITIRLVSIGAIFFIVKKPSDLSLYYGITLVTAIVNSLYNIYLYRNEIEFKIRFKINKHLRPLLYIFCSNVAISIYILLDGIILGFLTNDEYVGLYSVSTRLSKVLLALVSALSVVIVSKITAAYQKNDEDRITHLLSLSFQYVFLLTVPIMVGMASNADILVTLFAGKSFTPAILTVQIMSPLILLIGLSNIFGIQLLVTMGREKKLLEIVLAATLISVVANLILVPKYFHNGTAISNILTETFVTVLTGIYALRLVKIRIPMTSFYKALLASSLIIPISYTIKHTDVSALMQLVLIILSSAICYFIIQYFIFRNTICKLIIDGLKQKIHEKI